MPQFTQDAHPLLMIPGSIEFSDSVLLANACPALSHTNQPFIAIFQSALAKLRLLFQSTNPKDQAFVIAGSGTLGWDIAASNLIFPGENALVLSTGFFSDKFADCLSTYGANVDTLTAPIGSNVDLQEIAKQLSSKKYKLITITHVDTSTAVVSDIAAISKVVKQHSPDTLVVVDGVCSVAVEDLQFSNWGLDYVLTASQKAIGVPPGLSISFISERALDLANKRNTACTYFASLKRWDPIMKAYESGKGAYFATPAVQLVNALNVSLSEILNVKCDIVDAAAIDAAAAALKNRFSTNSEKAKWFKEQISSKLNLKEVSAEDCSSNALTAVYLPSNIAAGDFLAAAAKKNVVFAGGIHSEIKGKYFRVGHMGISAVEKGRNDVEIALKVIEEVLNELSK